MKLEIKDLPSIGWMNKLSEARYFSGCVGTSGSTGMFIVHTFHYRIWKQETEGEDGNKIQNLCVSSYIHPPQNSNADVFGREEKTFDLSDNIQQSILDWLNDQISQYPCIGKE